MCCQANSKHASLKWNAKYIKNRVVYIFLSPLKNQSVILFSAVDFGNEVLFVSCMLLSSVSGFEPFQMHLCCHGCTCSLIRLSEIPDEGIFCVGWLWGDDWNQCVLQDSKGSSSSTSAARDSFFVIVFPNWFKMRENLLLFMVALHADLIQSLSWSAWLCLSAGASVVSFSSFTICLTARCSDRQERMSLVLGLMKQSPSRYEIRTDIYMSCL